MNGEVPSEGRLEICYDDGDEDMSDGDGDEDMSDGDGWGVICDDYWTDVEADVACRQLGYVGAVDNGGRTRDEQGRSLPPLYFGAPDAGVPMWLDNLMCTGKETNLLECPRFRGGQSPGSGNLPVGKHNCRPSEAVGVRCTTSLPSDMPGVAPQTPPTVRVDPVAEDADGYYESIDVFLQFGAPVSVFTAGGTPTLSLRFGTNTDNDVSASYVGGSGSPRLLFRYVLPKPLVSQGTVRVVEDSLMAQGGVIRYVGSEVDLRLAHDGAAARPFVASPAETVWSDEDGNDTFGDGDKVEVTITFNEPVEVNTADGTPSVALDYFNDDADPLFEFLDTRPQAAYASGSGSAQLVFSYAVTADDGSPASIEARSLSLNGGSVRSEATTLDAFLYFSSQSISTAGSTNNQRAAPTVEGGPVLGEAGADGFWTAGETVDVRVAFSESVTVDTGSGTPSIGLLLGGAQARSAAYARGSGTAELVFGYTLAEGEGPYNAMLVPGDSLALNGGAIVSTADNSVAADLAHNGAGKTAVPEPASARATRGVADGPTASFSDVPATHDGETPFTVKLSFDEEPALSHKTVEDSLLEVNCASESCGTVTKASRVTQGSDSEWKVTVEPSQGYDITLKLPVRACGKTGAVCVDGRPLAEAASVTIPGEALTATLSGPAEHDGSESFTVRLTFSMEPEVSYKTVSDTMFTVTGGTITGAKRVKAPHDLEFDITVEPGGYEAVSLKLASPLPACGTAGAVCTAAGRKIEGTVSATIPGPVALSVADATVREAPGAKLSFAVTLDRERSEPVTVDYATSDGEAKAGSDYVAASGTLTFSASETSKTIEVEVLDDDIDEGSETLTLTLTDPSPADYARIADGTATGTIENSDPMPRAWLARFGRTVAEQVMGAVENRLEAARRPGVEVSLAGERIGGVAPQAGAEAREAEAQLEALSGWLRGEHDEEDGAGFRSRAVTERDLLVGSSFALTGGTEQGGFGALWGRAAVSRFDGREGDLSLDGEVTSAMVGADWTRGRATAGLLVSHSQGEGGYRSPRSRGEVESTLTGLYPYGRYRVSERLSLWGTFGYGSGEVMLKPEAEPRIDADMDLTMAGAGLRGELLSPAEGGGAALALVSDGFIVRTGSEAVPGAMPAAEAEVTRLRVGLEGSLELGLGGGRLVPSFEIGVRHDGGDAETGYGADIGAGLAWSDPGSGVEAEVQARGLLTHEDGGLRERGIAGSLAWDPDPSSERGFAFKLQQTVGGSATGGMNALLSRRTLEGLAANDGGGDLQRRRLEATLGYGFPLFGDRFTGTPEVGVGLSDADRNYRVGWRLALTRSDRVSFDVSLDAVRREPANDDRDPDNEIGLRLTARW